MNNLMKITASLALAILSGCVGSINAGDIGTGGNNPNGSNTSNNSNTPNNSNAINPITANSSELEILLSKVNSGQNIVSSVNFFEGGRITRHPNAVQVQHAGDAFLLTVSDRRYTLKHTRQVTQYQIVESSREDPDGYLFRIERDDLINALDPSAPKDYILFNYFGRGTPLGSIGFGVTGIQTPPDTIPTTAIATYSGKAYIDGIEPVVGSTSFNFNFNISARQTMTVDFAQKTISGSMTNIVDDSNAVSISSSAEITFDETTFNSDGSYRGELGISKSLDVLGIASLNGNAFYRGETYGANAASLAGVVEFQGLTTGQNQFYAIGGFYADKQ